MAPKTATNCGIRTDQPESTEALNSTDTHDLLKDNLITSTVSLDPGKENGINSGIVSTLLNPEEDISELPQTQDRLEDNNLMPDPVVSDIERTNAEEAHSDSRQSNDQVEVGLITDYDFKSHKIGGWISVDEDAVSSNIQVLFFGYVVGVGAGTSGEADRSINVENVDQYIIPKGFTIDVMSIMENIIDVIKELEPSRDTLIDLDSFRIVNNINGKRIAYSEDLNLENVFSDLNVLKNHYPTYLIIENEFDPSFYESAYGNQYDSSIDPIFHYLATGGRQGFEPNSDFNTTIYLYRNSDVEASEINPFQHYISDGRGEGRRYDYQEMSLNEYPDTDRNMLSQYFDIKFYWHTNPDQVGNEKALNHYLVYGWREGRDPSEEFDSSYYLEANPDVRASGMNPMFHYLKYGRNEERSVIRSRRVFVTSSSANASGVLGKVDKISNLTTSVLVMVKNELDIIHSFTSHILSLFDNIIFIDHNSKDGTLEFLESLANNDARVTIYHLEEESYIQAVTMNHMVRNLDIVKNSDWIFLLDCDEFLPYQNRAELDHALSESGPEGIVQFFWKNLIPEDYWDYEAKIDCDTKFLVPDDFSNYGKIAFRAEILDRSNSIWIAQGNHSILSQKDGEPLASHTLAEPLYHIPIRSINQLALKLNQGVVSYLKIGKKRDELEGLHWFQLLSNLEQKPLTPEFLNRLVLEYGENQNWSPISKGGLLSSGYKKMTVPLSFENLLSSAKPQNNIAGLILQTGASLAKSANSETEKTLITRLSIVGANRIQQAQDDNGYEFCQLPSGNDQLVNRNYQTDFKFITEFIKPSYWQIENLTPTAWGGHIQFLFCLVAMISPRRFVELGSHYGASFFAYCQATKRMNIESEPIAIDCWEGDDHTGAYESEVFEQFKYIFKKHESFAKYKRMFFHEAVEYFEDSSVDLLHIDGLHTYEAVKEDYDTWLRTLSDTGIILFHDINVHERDFGVWQFWSELKKTRPTMEFKHSHGLGIAYVGSDQNHPIMRLIEIFNADETVRDFLQHHFETTSQEIIKLALNEYALRDKDTKDVVIAELQNEIGQLKQKVGTTEALNEDLSNLISRKLSL